MNLSLTLAFGSLLLCSSLIAAEEKSSGPNVILIMADDVGIEAFPTYGGESYATPNLDRMAKEGIQFNHCYSQPLCTPSRVKIMTGRSNVHNYYDFSLLHPKEKTIGHHMQSAGYVTGIVGKWQLYGAKHYNKTAEMGMHPSKAGFDTYCLWQIENLGSRYQDPWIVEDGKRLEGKDKYGPDLFADFALRFIREHKDEPFFLYYPMVLVHDPFVPTPDSDLKNRSKAGGNRQANFSDMMSYMDKIVGRVWKEVKTQGIEENTVIIFVADNGTHRSISSSWRGNSVAGGKGMSTDAGTHVPLYAVWPKKIKAGTQTASLVDFADVLPTVLDIAGAKLPKNSPVTGKSFRSVLEGNETSIHDSIYVYSNPRPTRKSFPKAVFARDQHYKLYSDGRFYRVEADRLEKHNILAGSEDDRPKVRQKLQARLDEMPDDGQLLIDGSVTK